jgi:hypothetical protein
MVDTLEPSSAFAGMNKYFAQPASYEMYLPGSPEVEGGPRQNMLVLTKLTVRCVLSSKTVSSNLTLLIALRAWVVDSLATLQDRFSAKSDGNPHSHSFRTNDETSVTSSLISQGAGPASQTFRPLPPPPPAGQGEPPVGHEGLMTPPNEKATGGREFLNEEEEIY